MTSAVNKETRGFQTEVQQLLHLMIHSLYSNKEIFLRELISNASDAADKLRFLALSEPTLLSDDAELKIWIDFDKDARTLTVRDNGVGMTREEVIQNLGTIAKSGTKEFLHALTGDQAKDSKLIGQFGVGFYSAFIVADKVTVTTRRAGLKPEEAVRWTSEGTGTYELESVTHSNRGTEVVLHLKPEEDEFLSEWRLKEIIKKYSDHIGLPIVMKTEEEKDKQTEEVVNRATALWTLPKQEITDEQYIELYKHIAHDFENPLTWSHNKVEGKLEYTSVLYIPARAPFDLWHQGRSRGLKLYVRRVFIMDDAEQFLPNYLRFVRGIIDSNDLPLNVSREILQNNRTIDNMKSAITKRILTMLEQIAKDDSEKYQTFWKEFGSVLKEGPAEDFANREQIAKLLRFASTKLDTDKQDVSLEDYVARAPAGQDKIYYITGENFKAVQNSPHLEIFRQKGIEVLLLSDRVDEWLVSHLTEFMGKSLQSITKGDLKLGNEDEQKAIEVEKEIIDEYEATLKRAKEILNERVKDVRLTKRLTSSPACLVVDDKDMSLQMERLLKAAGHQLPMSTKPILELNPEHPMVKKLKSDQSYFEDWINILFDQAVLAEGGQLQDPAAFVKRFNHLLLELSQPAIEMVPG